MSIVRIIDFETGGTDPATSDVVEVGWVDVTSDGTIGEPCSVLCRPEKPVDIEARAVHHLSDQDLAGGLIGTAWQKLLMHGNPLAYIAHNAKFEMGFWPAPPAPFICTYKASLRLWPDAPRHTNQVLRYWLNLDDKPGFDRSLAMPPHRAGPDAYVTAWIFAEMLRMEGSNRLTRLWQWTLEPAMPPRLTFGKHKGVAWADVPVDYLQWLMGKSDMDEDTKYCAAAELGRRSSS